MTENLAPLVQSSAARVSRQQGLTIMEVTISITVLAVVSISVGQLFLRFSNTVSAQVRESHLTARSQVVMDRLLDELLTGQFVTMNPPIPDTSDWIRFQRPTDFVSGAVVYGDPIQIDTIAADGDTTRELRVWQDSAPLGTAPGQEDTVSILAGNVAPGGLVFQRFGSILEVNLTMIEQIESDGSPTLRTVVSGIRMRNSE